MKKIYKLPIKNCPMNIYIKDAEGHTMFNWLFDDDELKEKIVRAINGQEELKLGGLEIIDDRLYMKGKPILLVRGWGYLTGIGGLRMKPEEAIKIQEEMLEFVKNKLCGE